MKVIYSNLPTYSRSSCDHAAVPLDPVSDLSADYYFDPDYIKLTWQNPSPDVISKHDNEYPVNALKAIRVYRDGLIVYEGEDEYFSDIDVDLGSTYQYKVVAVSADGVESEAAEISLTYGTRYTIEFRDIDGTLLASVETVEGMMPVFPNEDPVHPNNPSWIFTGWSPELSICKGPATYYATYNLPTGWLQDVKEPLSTVIENIRKGQINNYRGKTVIVPNSYGIGAYKICKMDNGTLTPTAGGSAYALFVAVTACGPDQTFHTSSSCSNYSSSAIRSYANSIFIEGYQDFVKSAIKEITLSTSTQTSRASSKEKCFLATRRMMSSGISNTTGMETSGPILSVEFPDDGSRIIRSASGYAVRTWLSSLMSTSGSAFQIDTYGNPNTGAPITASQAFAPCFCI